MGWRVGWRVGMASGLAYEMASGISSGIASGINRGIASRNIKTIFSKGLRLRKIVKYVQYQEWAADLYIKTIIRTWKILWKSGKKLQMK